MRPRPAQVPDPVRTDGPGTGCICSAAVCQPVDSQAGVRETNRLHPGLAVSGLIAVSSDSLRRLPPAIAAALSWLGLGGILMAAVL